MTGKEININIEGYNVNGICVGCLNFGRKMYYLKETKEFYKALANVDIPDGLAVQLCWECAAIILNIKRFQIQIENTFKILLDYSKQHTFLNSPSDLTKFALNRLKIEANNNVVESFKAEIKEENDQVVKPEEELNFEDSALLMLSPDTVDDTKPVVKPEYNSDYPLFEENNSESEFDNIENYNPTEIDDDFDDTIALSKLYTKKEKKREKSKKKGKKKIRKSVDEKDLNPNTQNFREKKASQLKKYRKLKNIPNDLVEVWQMNEEEMRETRALDVVNENFTKLQYKCSDCIVSFNTEKSMLHHMVEKHQPKEEAGAEGGVGVCDVCGSREGGGGGEGARQHRARHLLGWRCRCGYRTTARRLAAAHVRDAHAGPATAPAPAPLHACTACGDSFATKSKLSYHRAARHQERPQCDCCGKVFANKITLKYHLKILPMEKAEKAPQQKLCLPCKSCGKVFPSRKSYRAHVVIHEGLEYPCPICGKLFQWKRNMARHIRNHRERDTGTFYSCLECNKRFASKDCYNNHMKFSKKHASEETYVHECTYCSKKFPNKWCLADHVDWDHLKRIKYQCPTCLKAFKTSKIMVAHMNNIHEGRRDLEPEGEHLCDVCGKSYKTVKRLKGHVRAMHTHRSTAKSFKCRLCPATFTWQTSIYKHMKMMHNGKGKLPGPAPPVAAPAPAPAKSRAAAVAVAAGGKRQRRGSGGCEVRDAYAAAPPYYALDAGAGAGTGAPH